MSACDDIVQDPFGERSLVFYTVEVPPFCQNTKGLLNNILCVLETGQSPNGVRLKAPELRVEKAP